MLWIPLLMLPLLRHDIHWQEKFICQHFPIQLAAIASINYPTLFSVQDLSFKINGTIIPLMILVMDITLHGGHRLAMEIMRLKYYRPATMALLDRSL